MGILRKVTVTEGKIIKCIDISEDKKYIYLNMYYTYKDLDIMS